MTSSLHFTLANMALAKGHSPKTKSQVSDIRTIGPLVGFLMRKRIINKHVNGNQMRSNQSNKCVRYDGNKMEDEDSRD